MRIHLPGQSSEGWIVGNTVISGALVDVGDRAQEQLLVCPEEETSVHSSEGEYLFLAAPIGFHCVAVIRSAIRRLHLFELIFAFEKLRQRDFLIANRRDEEQVQLSDVIDGDSRGAVSRRANGGEVERKSECVIKFLPARDQFHREVPVLELLIARAVEITLLELRLLP